MSPIQRFALAASFLLLQAGCVWNGERAQSILDEELHRPSADTDMGATLEATRAFNAGRRLDRERADIQAAGSVNLADCFRLALLASDSLRAGSEAAFLVETQRREAISATLPTILANANWVRDSNEVAFGGEGFTPPERRNLWLTVRQPVLHGDFLPTMKMLEHARAIAGLELRDTRDQLMFAVAASFYETLALARDEEAFRTSLASAREHERVTTARFEAGAATDSERLRAVARRAEAEAAFLRAGADLAAERARLEELVGLDLDTVAIDDHFEVETASDLPRLVDRALGRDLGIEMAAHEIERARADVAREAAEYLPTIDLAFTHWTDMEGGFQEQIDWTLAVDLEWTLFDSGRREARMARVLSTVRRRRHDLAALEKQVKREVKQAVHEFRGLDLAMDAVARRADAAADAWRATEERYLAGAATQLDVLESLAEREEAARSRDRAALARKLAALRIRLAVGDLSLVEPARRAIEVARW
jgi:outer membrane protein TolC